MAQARPDGLARALSRPHVHNEAAAAKQQQASHSENCGRPWRETVARASIRGYRGSILTEGRRRRRWRRRGRRGRRQRERRRRERRRRTKWRRRRLWTCSGGDKSGYDLPAIAHCVFGGAALEARDAFLRRAPVLRAAVEALHGDGSAMVRVALACAVGQSAWRGRWWRRARHVAAKELGLIGRALCHLARELAFVVAASTQGLRALRGIGGDVPAEDVFGAAAVGAAMALAVSFATGWGQWWRGGGRQRPSSLAWIVIDCRCQRGVCLHEGDRVKERDFAHRSRTRRIICRAVQVQPQPFIGVARYLHDLVLSSNLDCLRVHDGSVGSLELDSHTFRGASRGTKRDHYRAGWHDCVRRFGVHAHLHGIPASPCEPGGALGVARRKRTPALRPAVPVMVARRRLLVASQNRRDGCEKHADAPETALASPIITHGSTSRARTPFAHGHPFYRPFLRPRLDESPLRHAFLF